MPNARPVDTQERAEIAQELLRDRIDRLGYTRNEVRSVTGIDSRTVNMWYERIPDRVHAETIERIMLLENERPRPRSSFKVIRDPEVVERVRGVYRQAKESGIKMSDIRTIARVNQSSVWRLTTDPMPIGVSSTLIDGAARLERHLNKEQERGARRKQRVRDLIGT